MTNRTLCKDLKKGPLEVSYVFGGVAKDLGRSGKGLGKAITKAGPDLIKVGIDLTEPKTRDDFAHVILLQVRFRAFKVLGLHAIGQG